MRTPDDCTSSEKGCSHNTFKQEIKRVGSISDPREKNKGCYRGKHKGGIKMPYNRKAFGVVISKLRVQNGLTQEKLSGLAGISRSHLAALESGDKTVKLDTMWRIAEALEINPSELIRMTENEHPENQQGQVDNRSRRS